MNAAPSDLIDRFAGLNVLVIGEAMLDSYLIGRACRLSVEAPVPIVELERREETPGGAANVAANVAALSARVTLLSVIGDDAEGVALRHALTERGVCCESLLARTERRTLAKHRVLAGGQMLLRYDQGTTALLDSESEALLIERLTGLWTDSDAVIVSDYAYGILTPAVLARLQKLHAASPRLLAVDARDLRSYREIGITVAKPNYAEALRLAGESPAADPRFRAQQVAAAAEQLFARCGAQIVAVTLDVDGALVLEREAAPYRTYARPVPSARCPGAGDTYVAALAAGATTTAAAELASAAAAVVVEDERTAVCAARDLRARFGGEGKLARDVGALLADLEAVRRQGRRIVFTNGCFDLLHRGHITYLNRAKALGDPLVVGVNDDAGVRRLKGPARPINALEDRLQVLAALSCVDHLIAFAEDTPEALIAAIRPDVFVKGGDYTRETLPEAALVEALGGTVRILPYVDDRSTTRIVERIVAAAPAGSRHDR